MEKKALKWYTFRPLVVLKVTFILVLLTTYFLPIALVPVSILRGSDVYYSTSPLCLIVYDDLIPKESVGATRGYVIYIRPDLRDDPIVINHEKEHVRQWWYSLGLQKFYYALSKKHRLYYEYNAYLEGLKHSTNLEHDLAAAAVGLAHPGYNLDITPEVAYLLLESGINKHRGLQ